MKMRKEIGESVDSNNIRKHKKDILRIAAEIMLEKVAGLPSSVKADIHKFIDSLKEEPWDQNSLKMYGLKNADVVVLLRQIFG